MAQRLDVQRDRILSELRERPARLVLGLRAGRGGERRDAEPAQRPCGNPAIDGELSSSSAATSTGAVAGPSTSNAWAASCRVSSSVAASRSTHMGALTRVAAHRCS